MNVLKETAGDTLQGAIDGVNLVYTTTLAFSVDRVSVYVNGRLKVAEWDDGYTLEAPKTLRMKEALEVGDSLEVEYGTAEATGGGALAGVPTIVGLGVLQPSVVTAGLEALTGATNLAPETKMTDNVPGVLVDDLKPITRTGRGDNGCD
jgi:hypothetical protein